jgi:predicted ATPase with chaperone activity
MATITAPTASRDVVPFPSAAQSVEETGIPLDLILQLALKALHFSGELSGSELCRRLGLEFHVILPALDLLKGQQQISIVGGGFVGGASYRYRITDTGRTRAALFLESSHYVGIAPVPLAQYQAYMHAYRAAVPRVATQERVRQAFSHLVISDSVLDQLGPAINAGHSMFVYGPPGNGKTVISQAIHNLLEGDIAIPHALEIEGQIVRLFDPVNHEVVVTEHDDNSLTHLRAGDQRWVRCRRPMVMVGGELTLSSLELSYSPTTGFYRAPVQAVANGGVLVIDDFGRQQCSPRELLNRWIVPLESRVDFLTLQSGQKFELPFMTMIVFATNVRPAELVDEAFLRRIQYKIFAESPTVQDFKTIFASCCRDLGATVEPGLVERMLLDYYRPRHIPLRGCHPRDLIKQALSLASYLGRPAHLTPDLVEAACNSYFVNDREESVVYA